MDVHEVPNARMLVRNHKWPAIVVDGGDMTVDRCVEDRIDGLSVIVSALRNAMYADGFGSRGLFRGHAPQASGERKAPTKWGSAAVNTDVLSV